MTAPRTATVRGARRTETAAVAGLLATAMADDPLSRWLHPVADWRHAELRASFLLEVERVCRPALGAHVLVDPDGALIAAALWTPLPYRLPWLQQVRLRTALRRLHGERDPYLQQVSAATFTAAPLRSHWHLLAIGTVPDARGRGHGRALLGFGIARADAEGLPTHLETTEPARLGFYARAGYRVAAEVDLPFGGPRSTILCREAG
ncbi:GNAT family N-acetyltransferase [Nocardia harenae]|uniref:GNAT family N-acetyltransferase n=1 Tax=Nocardia harenae TaxID=358707 RepID=UPI000835D38F|nr:GNAT family N-acetyltransferase [Nocardia harenae]